MRVDLVVAAVACASLLPQPLAAQSPEAIRIADEAMAVVQSRCVSCHRAGGDAPFSLASFDEVRRHSATIARVVKSGYMPPWKPVAGYGEFVGARRITPQEIELLEQWVRIGAPSGSS
ncbi:MAG TPA: cytochrome c, partial [Vicinamibacterales bacterium]